MTDRGGDATAGTGAPADAPDATASAGPPPDPPDTSRPTGAPSEAPDDTATAGPPPDPPDTTASAGPSPDPPDTTASTGPSPDPPDTTASTGPPPDAPDTSRPAGTPSEAPDDTATAGPPPDPPDTTASTTPPPDAPDATRSTPSAEPDTSKGAEAHSEASGGAASAGPSPGSPGVTARTVPPPDALVDAVESIGTTLQEPVTCAELVAFVCRHFCDAAAVDLLPTDVPTAPSPPDLDLSRVATAGRVELLPPAHGPRPLSVEALDEGQPIAASLDLSGRDPRQVMTVPLLAHGQRYGVLVAVRRGPAFSEAETSRTHHAARLAAVHLGHARRHGAMRSTVLSLQRALLAEPGRPHPNLELATRYLPAGGSTLVGGDWFETVRLHFGRTLLVVGDVMGHGLDAAVDMNAYRSMLRYVAATDLPPHRVLRRLDAAVAEEGTRRPATSLLVRVDPARGVASLASAGHLPPVVFCGDGTGELVDLPVGPPLGTGVGGYEQTGRRLAPDDTLVMFTDGLVEHRGEDIDESLARLAGLRLPPGADVDDLLDAILAKLDTRHAEDDVAVLAARIRHRPTA
ncbi:SpoIIE family protein phosphatase [Streptomyces sp. Tue6028]|uniref:PP2C family protein-serine/threonine phosphatase n=1 Tax=Streptomyces sp. Tue6028 TaxID=2036037 RepID=UPI003EB86402